LRKFLGIFSYIFHPVFIPLIATGCFYYLSQNFYNTTEIYITLIQVAIMTFLLPVILFLFLKSFKMLTSSIMVKDTSERKAPVFLNIVLMYILVFQILLLNRSNELKLFLTAYAVSYSIVFLSLFFKKKYSLHMLSFSAFVMFMMHTAQSYYLPFIFPLCILILLLGLLASSRLVLQAHTTREILIGCLIGIIPQLVFHSFSISFL